MMRKIKEKRIKEYTDSVIFGLQKINKYTF